MTSAPSNVCGSSGSSLAFIGGGQMAKALAGGLINAGWSAQQIVVIDPNIEQRKRLSESLGVKTAGQPDDELGRADAVIWAVKPQSLREAIVGARPHLGNPLHISIAAGVSSADLTHWIASERVIRVMPNTAALVGAGVTGMLARPGVTDSDRSLASAILAATGYCFWVDSDDRLDAVTAVSGSGPAYLFHFLEGFQAAAEEIGFEATFARELTLRTVAGAIEQARRGDSTFGALRKQVTSKHGTTEAALAILDLHGTRVALGAAILAAYQRAGELSRELGDQA